MHSAPSFFLHGAKMKYYIVRSAATTNKEFAVRAESNADAINALLAANNENVRQIGHDTFNSTEVSESNSAAWEEAANKT
jgi:hypothetical protein